MMCGRLEDAVSGVFTVAVAGMMCGRLEDAGSVVFNVAAAGMMCGLAFEMC